MEINRREIERYLGFRGHPADPRTRERIESCLKELLDRIRPRSVYANYPVTLSDSLCKIGPFKTESHDLAHHLNFCKSAYLFAATLGPAPDLLIRRATAQDMSLALIYQASSAALIESYCNEVCSSLRSSIRLDGLFLKPRFSPGYGDFPLSSQGSLLRILEAEKRIGLTATESDILAPSKSVTAVIGVSAEGQDCHEGHCSSCKKADCEFRDPDA